MTTARSTLSAQQLYELLPAIYRLRDAEQDYPLRALLGIIAREIAIVEDDITRLYANSFVETADEWAIPYIGDLLGVRGLHALEATGITRRALVANTIGYRRRKGTPTMLEQLARDTTLWGARVVEFFELLGTTQYLNHLRPNNLRTPDLRRGATLEWLDTPFDTIAHTVDVRRIASGRGRHNIPNIGIFLWRLQAYYLTGATPRPVADPADGCYTFSPLGNDAPLFNRPQTETSIAHLAEALNVPGPVRRRALYDDLEALRQAAVDGTALRPSGYLGPEPVLQVLVSTDGGQPVPIPPREILVCDLSEWRRPPTTIAYRSRSGLDSAATAPQPIQVAVDPVRGRLAFPQGVIPQDLTIGYTYGFSGDLGGGPYDRRLVRGAGAPVPSAYEDRIAAPAGLGRLYRVPADGFATVAAAIAQWQTEGRPAAVIQIEDSRTYAGDLQVTLADADLAIQAANSQRPTLIGKLEIKGNGTGRLALDGLLIAGAITVADLGPRQLDVVHCTLVPGIGLNADGSPSEPLEASIRVAADNRSLTLRLVRSIAGPLRLGSDMVGLEARDCIIQAPPVERPAELVPVLVSAALGQFPADLPAAPRIQVTIGDDGPHLVELVPRPTKLSEARTALQNALTDALRAPVRVMVVAKRLVVVPQIAAPVTIAEAPHDDTAKRLGLTQGPGEQRLGLRSGPLKSPLTLSATTPTLSVVSDGKPIDRTLGAQPDTLAKARDRLHSAIRGAGTAPALAQTLVGSLHDAHQLVAIPGLPEVVPGLDIAPDDPSTLTELRLAGPLYLPAIGGDRSGAQPGPATTLERVTVLGPVHVKEFTLAAESIFTDPVWTLRRQAGCLRFCYVPPGSHTPRRFHCEPDLAIAAAVHQAQVSRRPPPTPAQVQVQVQVQTITSQVVGRLVPAFTSTRYGDPGYGQLSLTCPVEIRTGAEDGAELGAFGFLKQPQRIADLQSSLDEYLRFGLEAGIFFAT